MKHLNLSFLACAIVFCTCIVSIHANPERRRIFYFNSLEHGEENFIEYLDNTYIGFNYLQRDSLKDSLDVGNTYLLKITYSFGEEVDSCFTSYNFIANDYQEDGFWTYANNGILEEPTGFYGFYNIDHDEIINYEDYPDLTEEEMLAFDILSGLHFCIKTTGIICITIEIFKYTND